MQIVTDYKELTLTETIERLKKMVRTQQPYRYNDETIYNAIKALEQPRWIPVSERLPEKNMSCLVSVGKLLLTQIAIYSDLMGTIDHRIFYQGDYGHKNFVDITEYVKAWMPLPKPYEPQERSDKE